MALSNDEKRKVLEGGLDFAKTSTGVAAGALVLSIGWLGNFRVLITLREAGCSLRGSFWV